MLGLCTSIYAIEKPTDWIESPSIKKTLTLAGIEAGLPDGLVHCVAYVESRFNPKATSIVVNGYKSCGIMQLYRRYLYVSNGFVEVYSSRPETFKWDSPRDNAEIGCRYLAYLISRFGGSVYLGVLAYNYGETNVSNISILSEIPEHCIVYANTIMILLASWDKNW